MTVLRHGYVIEGKRYGDRALSVASHVLARRCRPLVRDVSIAMFDDGLVRVYLHGPAKAVATVDVDLSSETYWTKDEKGGMRNVRREISAAPKSAA